MSSQQSPYNKSRLILGILFVAALLLRLPGLNYSFYGDEWFSLLRDSSKLITSTEDRFRPLFFSLLFLWKQLGFSGEAGLRILPLLFGLLQIPLAYLVGKELRGERFGRQFALLITLSPVLIEFSQELRMYSLVAMLALLQVWLFLRLRKQSSIGNRLFFLLTALAGVYTHLFYWLFLMGLSLSFWRVRREIPIKQSIAGMAAVVLLYLPNLENLRQFAERRGGDYVVHLPSAFPKLLAAFTVGFNYFKLPEQGAGRAVGLQDLAANWLILLPALLAALIVFGGFLILHQKENRPPSLWLAHELVTVPILIAAFASLITAKYFLQPKYLIFCSPFLLLFLIDSVQSLNRNWLRRGCAGLGVLVFAIAMLHAWNPVDYGRRENWRQAGKILSNSIDSRTALLVLEGGYPLLDYYAPNLKSERIELETPVGVGGNQQSLERLCETVNKADTVYYLHWDTVQNLKDPRNSLVETLNRIRGAPSVQQLNPRLIIYSWKRPPGS